MLLIVALPWSIAPISVAGVACLALTVPLWLRDGLRAPLRTPVRWPWAGWLAAMGLAAAFALDPLASLTRIGKGLLPIFTPLAAHHAGSRKAGVRVVALLLGSAALSWAYGLGIYLIRGVGYPARARGAVGHYMTFAGQLSLVISVAAAVALTTRGRWRAGAALIAVLGVATLAATFTRSAWLGLGVSLVVILGMTRPRSLVLLAGFALAAYALAPGSYRDRIHSIFDPRHPTNIERTYMWRAGQRMFLDRPITGVGLQDLKPVYDRYRVPEARERAGHLHSVPVQIGATMGLVGLAAFAWLFTALVRAASIGLRSMLAAGRRAGGDAALAAGVRLGVLGGLAGFLVAGLFEWNFGDEELLYLLYTMVGIAWAARRWVAPPDATEPEAT